jgi:DNA-binding LacI/PurR family transcriptional regulator
MKGSQRPIGNRRTTIKDVAAALDVAVSTVSNAYNRPDQLSAELRQRVLATAARIGYAGPNPTARGLRRQSSGQVAVLLGRPLADAFADPVLAATLEGITAELSSRGFGLALIPERPVGGLPVADGVIALCPDRDDPLLTGLLGHGSPAVLVDHPGSGSAVSVTGDDDVAARGAIGHVIGLGHTRIAVVVDRLVTRGQAGRVRPIDQERATWSRTAARLRGYRQGAENAGMVWRSVPIYAAGANTEVAGQAIAELVLFDVPSPTVVLCTSDRLAAGIMTAARQSDIAIPETLSVVGFDDTALARSTVPPLTTVRLAPVEKGRAAARALIALFSHQPPEEAVHFAPKIVVRGSLGGVKAV